MAYTDNELKEKIDKIVADVEFLAKAVYEVGISLKNVVLDTSEIYCGRVEINIEGKGFTPAVLYDFNRETATDCYLYSFYVNLLHRLTFECYRIRANQDKEDSISILSDVFASLLKYDIPSFFSIEENYVGGYPISALICTVGLSTKDYAIDILRSHDGSLILHLIKFDEECEDYDTIEVTTCAYFDDVDSTVKDLLSHIKYYSYGYRY